MIFNRYFLDDIASQHIADNVAETMYKNITIAVRQGIRPYVIFRNVTNTHFRNFSGEFPTGVQFAGTELALHGLDHTYTTVKSIKVVMATKTVLSNTEFVLHQVYGDYTLTIDEGKPSARSAKCHYTIERITMLSTINMLNSAECKTHTSIYNTKTVINPVLGLASSFNEIVEKQLTDLYVEKFNINICSYLAMVLNPEAGKF